MPSDATARTFGSCSKRRGKAVGIATLRHDANSRAFERVGIPFEPAEDPARSEP